MGLRLPTCSVATRLALWQCGYQPHPVAITRHLSAMQTISGTALLMMQWGIKMYCHLLETGGATTSLQSTYPWTVTPLLTAQSCHTFSTSLWPRASLASGSSTGRNTSMSADWGSRLRGGSLPVMAVHPGDWGGVRGRVLGPPGVLVAPPIEPPCIRTSSVSASAVISTNAVG